MSLRKFAEFLQSFIAAAVVDENIIKFAIGNLRDVFLNRRIKKLDNFLLVVAGHDDCNLIHQISSVNTK